MDASPHSLHVITSLCSLNPPAIVRNASTDVPLDQAFSKTNDSFTSSPQRCDDKFGTVGGQASVQVLDVCDHIPPPSSDATSHACTALSTETPVVTTAPCNSDSSEEKRPFVPTPSRTNMKSKPTPMLTSFRRSATLISRRAWSSPFSNLSSFPASASPRAADDASEDMKYIAPIPVHSSASHISSKPFPCLDSGQPIELPTCSLMESAASEAKDALQSEESGSMVNCPMNQHTPGAADAPIPDKIKETVQKFHAVKELLTSEIGYLMDLKAFVKIYLKNLSTLAGRSPAASLSFRASIAFTSGPWMNSYSQLHSHTPHSPASSENDSQRGVPFPPREFSKNSPQSLLSDAEIDIISRNIQEILHFHEHLVTDLQASLFPLGFKLDNDSLNRHDQENVDNVDAAIRAVSSTFAVEAPRFDVYQSFCVGHNEALHLVQKVQHQYPAAWSAFEQRCSMMVSDMFADDEMLTESEPRRLHRGLSQDSSSTALHATLIPDRRRAISLTSSQATAAQLRHRKSGTMPKDLIIFPADLRKDKSTGRIQFIDYLIKPVQRVCRYHMLLHKLKSSKILDPSRSLPSDLLESSSDTDRVVHCAEQAMSAVAALVNDALQKQDDVARASLITSRIFLTGAVITPPPSRENKSTQPLTYDFLKSLGSCVLVGSVDVLNYHPLKFPDTLATAKYLGAFLYPGGYIILAKISKGKKYEPKHWFSLHGFDISDSEVDDAALAFSFRLSCSEHIYELGAACQKEKDAWLAAIANSLKQTSAWVDEPTPSFKLDTKGELIVSTIDEGIKSHFPSEVSDHESSEQSTFVIRGMPKQKKTGWRYDKHDRPSVKSIFSPSMQDIEVRRERAAGRHQIDQDLQDVLSPDCANARSHASTREEVLFPAVPSAELPRTNSNLSLSGMAKTRLTRYDSVRIHRPKSAVEGVDVQLVEAMSSKRRSLEVSTKATNPNLSFSSSKVLECGQAKPMTRPPSFKFGKMRSPSPDDHVTAQVMPMSATLPSNSGMPLISRSRSLILNVKGLWSASSISSTTGALKQKTSVPSSEPRNSRFVSPKALGWVKGSIRRRSRREMNGTPQAAEV